MRGSRVGPRAGRGGRDVAAHIRVSFSYPPKWVGFLGTPMSCHHRGITLLIGGEWGRARVPSGVAAAGHVWGHRSALEVFALHLSPDAMAQPVINEGEVERGRRRVLGWAQGGCGAGHTIGGSTFRRAGSQGGRGELPGKEGFARKNVGLVRSMRSLGEFRSGACRIVER